MNKIGRTPFDIFLNKKIRSILIYTMAISFPLIIIQIFFEVDIYSKALHSSRKNELETISDQDKFTVYFTYTPKENPYQIDYINSLKNYLKYLFTNFSKNSNLKIEEIYSHEDKIFITFKSNSVELLIEYLQENIQKINSLANQLKIIQDYYRLDWEKDNKKLISFFDKYFLENAYIKNIEIVKQDFNELLIEKELSKKFEFFISNTLLKEMNDNYFILINKVKTKFINIRINEFKELEICVDKMIVNDKIRRIILPELIDWNKNFLSGSNYQEKTINFFNTSYFLSTLTISKIEKSDQASRKDVDKTENLTISDIVKIEKMIIGEKDQRLSSLSKKIFGIIFSVFIFCFSFICFKYFGYFNFIINNK
jgi:hypothetical protein